jgi:predicted RNA-binding Zn-ribbon protein involved in translation (DUF1610 family)
MSLILEERKKPDTKEKKIKCPKCGAEIDHLKVVSENHGTLRMSGKGPVYEWISDVYGDEVVGLRFECPECEEVLFTDQYEAEQFLLGD